MTEVVEIFVGLLLAVAVLALVARKLHIPYPILFVIGGLLLGLIPGLPKVRLNPELVFLFVLPPLLFPAALFTSWRDFRANLRPISLARHRPGPVHHGGGRVSRALFHGPAARRRICPGRDHFAARCHRRHGDCRTAEIPRRIVTILEGESLVNDATALVAYRFAVAAVVTGSFSLAQASGQFFIVGLGGILIGPGDWLAGGTISQTRG
jgi:NhaP-type Na+/H+ or K+/H+ antiporter